MDERPILTILRSVVQDTPPVFSEQLDLKDLYLCAAKQNLLPVLAYANKRWQFIRDAAMAAQLQMNLYGMIARNLNRCEAFNRLSERLTEQGIPHMPVKGYYLRELYPVPELRTFGDIDVLIHQEDREKTDALLRQLGYTVQQAWEPTYTYLREQEYYEFHTNLMDGNLDGRTDLCAYFAGAWDHALPAEGLRCAPSLEFHLIYIICHLAKHLYHGGAGLRMYLDAALYLKRWDAQINWTEVRTEFEKLKLTTFFETVLLAACSWFGVETVCPLPAADEEALEQLLTYTLDADLFGHLRDHAVVNLRNEERLSRKELLRKMIFPPAEQIQARYTFLQKRPWLLPAAWIARLAVNIRLLPERMREMKQVSKTDLSEVSEYDVFMNRLGL